MRIVVLVLAGMLVIATAALAGEIEPLMDNGGFAAGGAGWEASESVTFGPFATRDTTAYDPWPYPGASGYIRQVIDNSKSPGWNPLGEYKIETLQFDLYTEGIGYIQIGFDWWDTYFGNTKPTGPAPYWEVVPIQFMSPYTWTTYTVDYNWKGKPGQTWQPRWTSVEIYFFGCTSGNEAGVDTLVLTSRCVPEPSSLLALSGLLGFAGIAWRRRR